MTIGRIRSKIDPFEERMIADARLAYARDLLLKFQDEDDDSIKVLNACLL